MFSGRAATLKWQAMTLLHASAPSHLLQKRRPPPSGSNFLRLLLQKRLCPPFKGCFPLVSLQNRRPPPSQSRFAHLVHPARLRRAGSRISPAKPKPPTLAKPDCPSDTASRIARAKRNSHSLSAQ